MFAFAIEYLTGRVVATRFNDRERPEWPPHPARLFSALVVAHHETGAPPRERDALLWLERQPAPALAASAASERETVTVYVPVNDSNQGLSPVAGDRCQVPRERQPRTFPSVTPASPVVYIIWPRAEPSSDIRETMASLAAKVTRLGHSSSLVLVRVCDDPPPPSHEPSEAGRVVLRVLADGQLAALEHAHEVFRETGIRQMLPCRFQGYRAVSVLTPPATAAAQSVFGDMVVFRRREGPHIPVRAAVAMTSTLRRAALAVCGDPIPEVLSGHRPDGTPSAQPHVAFVPLPDVGHPHADGHLLGLAAVLPRELTGADRRTVLRALGRVAHLTMGAAGIWHVERVGAEVRHQGLQPETWTRPSGRWATVTPVVLDGFPADPHGIEAETMVATACQRIGLPRPAHVRLTPGSVVLGAPPWHVFLPHHRDGESRRPHVHAVVTFAEPVRGPVLLGAGRYRGLGLCRPIPSALSPGPMPHDDG